MSIRPRSVGHAKIAEGRLAGQGSLIVHVIHKLDVGGLENGLVNLLNRFPSALGRHLVISLTTANPAFLRRIVSTDVEVLELHKPPGQTARVLPALFRELRKRKPDIVHTRNIAALECQLAAAAARVPVRIHGEHGWDVNDLHGANRRYLRLRRMIRPLVHHQIALSQRTRDYLVADVGVPASRVSMVVNGVDTARFRPRNQVPGIDRATAPAGWWTDRPFVIGTVGRLAAVKNQRLLCEAFLLQRQRCAAFCRRARLLLVGNGPDRPALERLVESAAASHSVWFAGEQADVAPWYSALALFCLPSLAEGISNGILEAMSTGLPVVATDVGGNAELVDDGVTGKIVRDFDPSTLADAFDRYFADPGLAWRQGQAGRSRAASLFNIDRMVDAYAGLYARLTNTHLPITGIEITSCAG